MKADAFLCAVIFVAAPRSGGSTIGHEAFPWSIENKQNFPPVCDDLLQTTQVCDDAVRNSDHFKMRKGVYSPVMEERRFRSCVSQCATAKLTLGEMTLICSDLRPVKRSLGCYGACIQMSMPEDARAITRELAGIFQDCILKTFKPHNETANSTVAT